ncbi:hypothetical protein TNCV_3202831 [Trichonephila clavipes]|nr:hypothetical protein TNCV_3202831 [Trichonephila clavipes]
MIHGYQASDMRTAHLAFLRSSADDLIQQNKGGSLPTPTPQLPHPMPKYALQFKNLRTYYRNEKQKLSFRGNRGVIDLVPKMANIPRCLPVPFDDTIQPLDSISNLDNMEPEVNASPSESELPQRVRVCLLPTPPVTPTLNTSLDHLNTSSQKRKVESSQEAFYESMEKCLGAVGKNSQ